MKMNCYELDFWKKCVEAGLRSGSTNGNSIFNADRCVEALRERKESVRLVPATPEPEYRELGPLEEIQRGDEVSYDKPWDEWSQAAGLIGEICAAHSSLKARRRIVKTFSPNI